MEMLVIAEKPSLGADVAEHLGAVTKKNREYIEVDGGRIIVSWVFGHIFGLVKPEYYIKKGRDWTLDDIPFFPDKWVRECTKVTQFNLLKRFIKDAKVIVHCGDPDREGQLLVDEVLMEAGVNPSDRKIKRLWSQSVDEVSLKKAIANMVPNAEKKNLCEAALARQRGDYLAGFNYSMLYQRLTQIPRTSMGRVRTPTLAMVVNRDRAIENFRPHDFYVPWIIVKGKKFTFKKCHKEFDVYDEEGRLVDVKFAAQVVEFCSKSSWKVIESTSEVVESAPPLPHSLDSLQPEANSKFGYSAKRTLEICQALYEKHKLLSYPRTDCRYLPETMFDERAEKLKSIYPFYKSEIAGCSKSVKSKAFNDKKIAEAGHHGLVPTGKVPNMAELSEDEKKVFDLVCRYFIAQFYPNAKSLKDHVTLNIGGVFDFAASETTILEAQWRALMGESNEDVDME